MMMRSVYRLIGLAKRYGPQAAEAACARALDVDVINVSKIESMLKNATEKTPAAGLAAAASAGPGRFARDAAEYATATGVRLQVVDGGSDPPAAAGPDLPAAAAAAGSARRPARAPVILRFPGFLFIPFLLPSGKEKERPLP